MAVVETSIVDTLIASGPTGLVLVLIISGLLVTKKHLDDIREDRNTWRSAYEKEHEARLYAEKASEMLIEQGKLAVTLLKEIRQRTDMP